jgi:hypothetical protein
MSTSLTTPLACVALGAAALLAACSGSSTGPTSPPSATTSVVGVSPAGGATNVSVGSVVTLNFDHAMMSGMEQYVALHRDSLLGPLVPGTMTWSDDRMHLTFTPGAPLAPHTTYVLHVGGGMIDSTGTPIDYGRCAEFGGHGVTGGMMGDRDHMGGGHRDGDEMGPGWQGHDGGYGMEFAFTTA